MAVSGAERFIRIEPSPVPMNEDAYRRIGTSLHDPGPLPPLEPNNSLASVAYEPDVHRYGGATALALVERNFMASSAIVLRFLRMSPPREERRAAGLRASFIGMAALEQLARSDLSTGLPHAVAVQEEVMERLPTQARSRMCKQYEQWAPELRRLWSLARARTLSESDDVRLWHQLVIQLLGARAEGSKPTNLLFPLLNCLHMHSNRLGIFPADEAFHSYSLIRLLVDG
jgi:thiopeptide-type bacteriocin biosynthesis protein